MMLLNIRIGLILMNWNQFTASKNIYII